MPKGGKRPGAGIKKGFKYARTIEKEIERERLRRLVIAKLEPMVEAQIAHAQGVSYMVLRHPDGTFARATDADQIDAACAEGAEAFQIFTQAPNVQAFSDLMNRTLDKPPEQLQVTGQAGGPLRFVVEVPWRRLEK